MHIAVKREIPRRGITDRHRNDAHLIKHIIQIVSAVRPHRNIRRIETHFPLFVERIRIPRINHAFIPPVPQIVHRRRPADIISHTEYIAVIKIMRTINIDPIAEHIRFSVRNIFPGRQIRIHRLFTACFVHCLFLLLSSSKDDCKRALPAGKRSSADLYLGFTYKCKNLFYSGSCVASPKVAFHFSVRSSIIA